MVKPPAARGRSSPLFDEAISVDFVTAAGAGGRIVSVLESARNLNLRGHPEFARSYG